MSSLSKAIKNQHNIFRILRLILFLAIILLLFVRLSALEFKHWNAFAFQSVWPLILCILLMPVNWWLEYRKWDRTVRQLGIAENKQRTVHSFLAGIVTGMITPNMLGNFLGRMYYYERKDRANIVLFTLINGHAQFLVTMIAGLVATMIAGQVIGIDQAILVETLAFVGIPIALIIYFYIDAIFKLLYRTKGYMLAFAEELNKSGWYRFDILFWSLLRYVVFGFQFILVLQAFGTAVSTELVVAIAQMYLIITLIPTLFFGKLGVRESVGLVVLGSVGVNEYAIIFASLMIWAINLLIPTFISLVVCKRIEE